MSKALLDAFIEYIDAKRELDTKTAYVGSYEDGYYFQDEAARVEKLCTAAEHALNKHIEEQVKQMFGRLIMLR